jgi:hypothetical protein
VRRYTAAEARALREAATAQTKRSDDRQRAIVALRQAAPDLAATVEALEAELAEAASVDDVIAVAREAERSAVVAYLREQAESFAGRSYSHRDALLGAAGMIERGSHRVSR